MAKPIYIAVAGNMGSGKSTLVDFICRTYGVQPFFEPNANNPYMKLFYGNMKSWAFHSQLYFLTHKFRIHQELDQQKGKKTIVQDRTIFEDAEIFAEMLHRKKLIHERDWGVYQDLYRTILNAIEPPDILIYLRANLRTIRKRIKMRGRPEEQDIDPAYLKGLNQLYEKWFASYKASPTLVLQIDKLDYLSDLVHRIDVLKTIEKYVT